MKIDIGNGKILGTKRVSPNGQVSGFTEYAGQEVLVVLPGGEPDVKLDAMDFVREVQTATNEHMKVAFAQYRDLKRRFETPERATREFLQKHAPQNFSGLYDKVEAWVTEQVDRVEQKVEHRLHKEGTAADGDAATAPAAPTTSTTTTPAAPPAAPQKE